MYDSMLGAFISVDPVMDLADPQQWNAYAYSNQNPVTWSDPTGLLLGPLIDGAYTAPTAGKPGSGGWQVGANNTGYTGNWNSGGAGSWARPGTTYTPPVRDMRAELARAAAAQRAERKRIAERNAERERLTEEADRMNLWKRLGEVAEGSADWIEKQVASANFKGVAGDAVRGIASVNILIGFADLAVHCTSTGADCTNFGELSLYSAQVGNEALWSSVYAALLGLNGLGVGASIGAVAGAPFAVVGAGPGAAIGATGGGIFGAGIGAMAGAATGRGMNGGIEAYWRRNGWID